MEAIQTVGLGYVLFPRAWSGEEEELKGQGYRAEMDLGVLVTVQDCS